MKIFQVVLLAIVAVLFVAFFCFGQDVTIEPEEMTVSLVGGESVSGEIVIKNSTDKKLKIRIRVENWANEVNGQDIWGLADWVTINPSEVEIPAEGQVSVQYLVVLPEGVEGPHWAGIRFDKISQTVEGDKVFKTIALATIKQTDPKGLIHGALVVGIGSVIVDGQEYFLVQVQKTGTGFNAYSGKLTLYSQEGGMVQAFLIPEFNVLPFHMEQVMIPYDLDLSPGVYQVIVEIHLDDELTVSGIWHLRTR